MVAVEIAARRYGDRIEVKNEITGPGGGPLQVDVLVKLLLTPANLEQLLTWRWRGSVQLRPELAAPAGPVIEGTCEPVEGEFSEVDHADEGARGLTSNRS
jgi:hypothetical protein